MTERERKIESYRKALDDGILIDSIAMTDHVCNHVKRNEVDLLDRILSEERWCNSTFEDKDAADMYMDETLYNKMPEIIDWLEYGSEKQFAVVAQFTGEVTGEAFVQQKSDIKAYEYDSVTVVLERYPYEYGFKLVTAYPSKSPESRRLDKDLMPVLKQTPTYQKANPVEQTYMEYQVSDSPYQVNRFEDAYGCTKLQMMTKSDTAKYKINIGTHSNSCTIQIVPNDRTIRRQTVPYHGSKMAESLKEKFPETMKTADELFESIQAKLAGRKEKVKSVTSKFMGEPEYNDRQLE